MSEGQSGNVVRFPIKAAVAGRVYCPPLNIHFPQLFRILQPVTRADLEALGETEVEPVENFIDYTLDQDHRYYGKVECEAVRNLAEADRESIVVRHHRSFEEAMSYLDAVSDLFGLEDAHPIFKTKEGLFTLARRQTDKAWPGPMVIYVAVHPADNLVGSEVWQVAIAPDGSANPDIEL
jgi:hypothetical protein